MSRSVMELSALRTPRVRWEEELQNLERDSNQHIHPQKHTHQQAVPGFLSVQPPRLDAGRDGAGRGFVLSGWGWGGLPAAAAAAATQSLGCLYCFVLAITWFSPLSASAAAGAWHSSEPWSWWWKWQSSRPWPAPPSQTPTTASSHPGNPELGAHAVTVPTLTSVYTARLCCSYKLQSGDTRWFSVTFVT